MSQSYGPKCMVSGEAFLLAVLFCWPRLGFAAAASTVDTRLVMNRKLRLSVEHAGNISSSAPRGGLPHAETLCQALYLDEGQGRYVTSSYS